MILAVADDLMFRSKISAAAKGSGFVLKVATSPDAVVTHATELRPSVILIDLDGQRTQPLETLRRLKAEPTLTDVPTVGFVSHVHADLIQEARRIGIGEVYARSAFSASLPAILASYETPGPGPVR